MERSSRFREKVDDATPISYNYYWNLYKQCSDYPTWACNYPSNNAYKLYGDTSLQQITDEVFDLSGMSYTARTLFIASDEFLEKTFNDVYNVKITRSFSGIIPLSYSTYMRLRLGRKYYNFYDYYMGANVPHPAHTFGVLNPETKITSVSLSPSDNKITDVLQFLVSDAQVLGSKSFSLANFIAELRELVSLTSLFKLKLSDLSNWSSGTKTLADKNLAYNFGLLPFFDDMQAIYDLAANLQDRVDRWNSLCEKGQLLNSHAIIDTLETSDAYDEDFYFSDSNDGGINSTISVDQKLIQRGHAYYYGYPILGYDIAQILVRLTGLNKPLSVIWEGIPFSFLVDWIVNVGDQIEAFEASDPVIRVELKYFGVSGKLESVATSRPSAIKIVDGYAGHYEGSLVKTTYTKSEYLRVEINPHDLPPVSIPDTEWTWEQSNSHVGLFASLVAQATL